MATLAIDIWSDIACPWCWVGKRHLEAAIETFEHEVHLTWRAFELDPKAPTEAPESIDYAERLAEKYRTTLEGASEMIDRMVEVGSSVGLELRFDRIRPTNTFAAHRLLSWSSEFGHQTDLKERFFSAYLREGRAISDPEVLSELAADVGLDASVARAVLDGETHTQQVRDDLTTAARLGIRGVPFFVIDRRIGVSGAQPAEELLAAMRGAVEEAPMSTATDREAGGDPPGR